MRAKAILEELLPGSEFAFSDGWFKGAGNSNARALKLPQEC